MTQNEAALKFINEQKEFLDTTVKENIEKHRKADAVITVTDKNGNPIKNAEITVKQTSHEFKFGANIFMLDEFDSEEYNEKYKEIFPSLFNMATVPFYWSTLEPEQGKPRYSADSPKIYRRPAPDLCIDFCEKHGIEPKLHCLAYEVPAGRPEWLPDGYAYNAHPKWNENKVRGGLFHHDLTPKKSGEMLDYLINEEWRTNESTTTDNNGAAHFRGFYGSYEITVKCGDTEKTVNISHSKTGDTKVMIEL